MTNILGLVKVNFFFRNYQNKFEILNNKGGQTGNPASYCSEVVLFYVFSHMNNGSAPGLLKGWTALLHSALTARKLMS